MPRDRKAEKAAEKKREELERKQEQERDRQREEERRQHSLELEREFEQQEERRRQQAEAARLRAAERRRQERHAQQRAEQLRQQHAAERNQARHQAQRQATIAQGREQQLQEEQGRERSEARRHEEHGQAQSQSRADERRAQEREAAASERRASEREDGRRQEQRQAQADERRREDQQRTQEEQRADERGAEQQSARQAEARTSQRSEERKAESEAARRADAHAAQRSEERDAQRSEERKADAREAQRSEEQSAQRSEERAAQRSEERQAETRAAQRSEERVAQRSEERAAEQSDERAAEKADERRQQQLAAQRREAQLAENQAARKQEQAQADKTRAKTDARRRQLLTEDRAAQKQQQIQANQARGRAEREAPTEPQLRARLPHGHLSNGLPWLITSGNRIVSAEDATSPPRAVILRGINRSGLEYSEPAIDFLGSAGITQSDVAEMISWGVNIVRVPFNQDWALHGRGGHPATEYLDNLDQLIFWLSSQGAYTLLDLQWLDRETVFGKNGDGSDNHVAPLPNLDSITVWTLLASRYQNEPAVLYDIFNEPHAPLADDLNPLFGIREDGTLISVATVTMDQWKAWARQLVAAIRRVHPNSLIFVSGVDWGYNLQGMPLPIVPGGKEIFASLVYSTHVYPSKGPKVPLGTQPGDIPTLAGTAAAPNWADAFGRLSAVVPVFAGEWGGTDADAAPWGEGLAMYMSALGMGWTAWSWVDWPYLRQASLASGTSMPTRFGNVVRHWLAMP